MDLDAFFCSVEELRNPDLRGKPFVVGGSADGRGVISSASYPARVFGVRSAMPTAQALRLCPDLIVISSDFADYRAFSKRVMRLLRDVAPVVEQISVDEAFIDLVDDPNPAGHVAASLQSRILHEVELPTSWGIATNKLVAKIATEVGKPRGLVEVPPGEEARFLAALPASMLWGVGPKTELRLAKMGIRTIGDLQNAAPAKLSAALGDWSHELQQRALGRDDRPVEEEHKPKSMSAETTFSKDLRDSSGLESTLLGLAEEVGARLRRQGYAGTTIRLKLRWPDFTTITRQVQLSQPTDIDREIFETALALLRRELQSGRAVRLIGVGVSDLGPPMRQLDLFDRSWQKDEKLLQAVDQIRGRYGQDALRRAAALGKSSRRRWMRSLNEPPGEE